MPPTEAAVRGLEVENAHERHNMAKGRNQLGNLWKRPKSHEHQGSQPQKRQTGSRITIYAVDGQIKYFPQQALTFRSLP